MAYTPLAIPVTVAQGGTGATSAANAATNLGVGAASNVNFGTLALSSSSTTLGTITSTDAGATAGPIVDLYRNSASPAAADVIGQLDFNGVDSGAAKQEYASIEGRIISTTAGSEKGALDFYTVSTGAKTKQIALLDTGGQYRGNNTNTAVPAGYIGEQLTTGYVSGIALTTATPFNLGSLSITPGIWMFYAQIVYTTTSSVSGNTDWFCSFNTVSATLPGAGLQQVDIGGLAPRNGGNNLTISHHFYIAVSANTTWYCVGQGSGSSVFASVTGNGAFWAVRVG